MSLLSNFKSLFKGSGRVDISQRFELLKEAISGTMSSSTWPAIGRTIPSWG